MHHRERAGAGRIRHQPARARTTDTRLQARLHRGGRGEPARGSRFDHPLARLSPEGNALDGRCADGNAVPHTAGHHVPLPVYGRGSGHPVLSLTRG